jgi:hypothetical protein
MYVLPCRVRSCVRYRDHGLTAAAASCAACGLDAQVAIEVDQDASSRESSRVECSSGP